MLALTFRGLDMYCFVIPQSCWEKAATAAAQTKIQNHLKGRESALATRP